MYGALAEPMIWYVEWFSMTIHTTCCQAAGGAVRTPHGCDELGSGPAGGAGAGAGGGTGSGEAAGGACVDGVTLVVPAGLRMISRGACLDSRLARTIRPRPLVASASESTPLRPTRRVTLMSFQWWARSAPECTTAFSVLGSARNVRSDWVQPVSAARRRRRPFFELVSG